MTQETILDLKVLLWSHSQQCFDSQTVGEMLVSNWDSYLCHENPESDWIVVSIASTEEAIAQKRESLKAQLDVPRKGD